MMNRINLHLIILFLTASTTLVNAQQRPHYTQYILNQYILNPAITGIENYTDVKVSHRVQWQGLTGAPVTTYLSLHAPIGKKDYKTNATSFPVNGQNPRGSQYWQDYEASAPHHGIGLQVVSDKAGPFNTFTAYGTYAYHIGLNSRTNLSAGFGLGVNRVNLNTNKLYFGNGVTVDPAVQGSGILGRMKFDMNAGIWLYSADYFAGVSVQQVVPQQLEFSENVVRQVEGRKVPHFFATTGFRMLVSDDINMIPSVMVKYVNKTPLQADLNLKFQYRDLLWAGASYRTQYGFAAMAGIRALNSVMISYSYDYTTTRLNQVSNGSHEIILGFMLGNRYNQETCPKNVW